MCVYVYPITCVCVYSSLFSSLIMARLSICVCVCVCVYVCASTNQLHTHTQEEQFMTAVEVRVKLPDELKPALVDDWDLINRQRKLPIVPARVTVDSILADYIRAKTSNKNNTPNK